jgi:hypothetical protein
MSKSVLIRANSWLKMEPHGHTGKARDTSISSAESAEAYPPAHNALEVYPFHIHPRLKAPHGVAYATAAVVFCEGG